MNDEDRAAFTKDLTALINKHSLEQASDTPDFMLALHLVRCLENYNRTVQARDMWLGKAFFAAAPSADGTDG